MRYYTDVHIEGDESEEEERQKSIYRQRQTRREKELMRGPEVRKRVRW